jgi:hypothetical protein
VIDGAAAFIIAIALVTFFGLRSDLSAGEAERGHRLAGNSRDPQPIFSGEIDDRNSMNLTIQTALVNPFSEGDEHEQNSNL